MQYDSLETSETSRFGARFSVHHLFLKPLSTGISEKNASLQVGDASWWRDCDTQRLRWIGRSGAMSANTAPLGGAHCERLRRFAFLASPDGAADPPCARASGIPGANTYSARRRNRRPELCSWAADHRQKIAKARRATRTPSNGLETANQKETHQPESWVVRVRSPCSLCVAACTELNQLQRQALSSTLQQLRSLNIACEAFMVPINKRPKCLRQVARWN